MTAERVALVSDSASVRHGLHERLDVAVVPLQVVIDGVAYDDSHLVDEPESDVADADAAPDVEGVHDGDESATEPPKRRRRERKPPKPKGPNLDGLTAVTASQVAAALVAHVEVSTSRPAPQRFADTYRGLRDAGYDQVVSVHLSGEVSGTCEAARMAAAEVDIDVRVVDSRLVDIGTGFAVRAAAEAIGSGGDADAAAEAAKRCAARTHTLFYVDSLEYLRRGGRVGAAAAVVGLALAVKPLLQVTDGRIVPLERVRTAGRALARLEELAAEYAADDPVDVAVSHLAAQERAQALADHLAESLPEVGAITVGEVGSAVGAHVGPGTVAVTLSKRG